MPLTPPSLSFDVSDDFLLFDNLEVVEYLSKQTGEVFIDPDVKALVHVPTTDEPEQSGVQIGTFHIRPKDLTYEAKPRDEILRSDGSKWVVNEVFLETFLARYRLVCTRARVTLFVLTDDQGVGLLDDDNISLMG